MSFETQFKSALVEMIPKDHDDCTEMQYSDTIYVQVWSHDNGTGSFEIYAIIPHDQVNKSLVDRDSGVQLSQEIADVTEFYSDVESYLRDVTGNDYSDLVFYLQEVVDDGVWERDATSYVTHELTTE